MTIQNVVKAKIEKDLEELELSYKKDLKLISEDLMAKTKNLERKYNNEISNVVDSELNMHKFFNKKESQFKTESNFNQELDQIYLDMITEIIESKFGRDMLAQFVSQFDKKSQLTLSGTLSDKLISELKLLHYLNIEKVKDESNLGLIVYQEQDRSLEFSLEELINKVKKMTLNKIIESL